MNAVFADTFYWYGLANPRDQWHGKVLKAKNHVAGRTIVTTEEVLSELLAAMSGDAHLRGAAQILLEALFTDAGISVIPQSHQSFILGFELYKNRPDKSYSLTDCISMCVCQAEGITEVLTNDRHFAQEGFVILIKR
jgi:predicted nucleic acid-binding protein